MKRLTIRDFRTRPRKAQETLKREGEALLTSNGRPIALMVGVDDDSLEGAVETLRRVRALQALGDIRRETRYRGLDRLTAKDIASIVAKSRKERRPA